MGWFGHGLYDGDVAGTQTCHYNFIKWAKIEKNDDIIFDWLTGSGTEIPENKRPLLFKNYKLILKKLGKLPRFWEEDDAIEWQMLLALFVDNNIKAPKEIYDAGIEATEYLIEKCSDDFNYPAKRRAALRNFIKRTQKNNK